MTNSDLTQLFHGRQSTPRQIVTLGYGKANLSNVLATYASLKVTAPFARVSAISSGARHGQNVTQVGRYDLNGAVLSVRSEHENGTVMLLQSSWRRGGSLLREGGLFLRLRLGAPLYEIHAKIPRGYDNVAGESFLMFSGYADIVNPDELKLIGIEVNRSFINRFMDNDELEECYRIVQLTQGTQERPTITAIATPTGIEMREVPQAPARRLILRGKK